MQETKKRSNMKLKQVSLVHMISLGEGFDPLAGQVDGFSSLGRSGWVVEG